MVFITAIETSLAQDLISPLLPVVPFHVLVTDNKELILNLDATDQKWLNKPASSANFAVCLNSKWDFVTLWEPGRWKCLMLTFIPVSLAITEHTVTDLCVPWHLATSEWLFCQSSYNDVVISWSRKLMKSNQPALMVHQVEDRFPGDHQNLSEIWATQQKHSFMVAH